MSDYSITLEEGISHTTNWRSENTELVKGFKIDKQAVEDLFSDENAVAMRVYLGLNDGAPKLVYVGVDENGKDILTDIYDHAEPCPTNCDETSVLSIGE